MNADAIDEPTEEAGRRLMKASDTLAGDLNVCAKLTKLRGWKTATVHDLAVEGSLGFEDGKLCFLYDSGMKVRCRRNDERIIFWAFGKPWIWRGSFLSIPS